MADVQTQPATPTPPISPIAVDAAKSVFINCPFDPAFEPLFQAIIFAVVACDFMPRSALESGTVAEPRMDRITRALFSSQYSIHDLSRCRGEGDEQLARFNMPLELGIAMARRYLTRDTPQQHDWLLLVPEGHVYVKVISDLAGFDPMKYDGTVPNIVQRVVSWLATRPHTPRTPTPKDVLNALPAFQAEFAQLKQNWGSEPPWPYVVEAARKTAPRT
jgi:hypothetical protein